MNMMEIKSDMNRQAVERPLLTRRLGQTVGWAAIEADSSPTGRGHGTHLNIKCHGGDPYPSIGYDVLITKNTIRCSW